ncbi:MAG TPA: glycosyltransferase family 39 protein [Rhizomicrobium sp.]|nr:glycosyltransferase family 39 protein [Rhizomicrobium sp.]
MGNAIAELIRRRPLVLLFLVCFVAWLPGFFSLPPLDRDESRFAQASKQMLESGNFVDIRFGNEPRYKKPVGIYWLQAAATEAVSAATGDHVRNHIWTYRIPSLIGAFAAVALTFWCASAFLEVEASFLAALLMGLTLLLSAEAKIAKTDAVLLATVVGAMAVLLRAYLARDPERPPLSVTTAMLGWLAFAIGILIKGPVIVGVVGVTVAALALWDREWRWLGKLYPARGAVLTLFVVLPWLLAIWFASHGQFYSQALGHDFGAKLAGGQETHGQPPGYYLLMTTATLWPATLFLIPAVAMAILRRREPAMRFLIAWAGASWLLFEIVPTKLPHYIMPAYPALAIAMAAFVAMPEPQNAPRWWRMLPAFSAGHFLIGSGLIAVALVWLPKLYGTGTSLDLMIGAGAVALLCLGAATALLRGAKSGAVLFAGAAALIAYAVLMLDVAPRLEQIWVSPREAALIQANTKPGDPAPVLAGYTEPSAMFLIGTGTHLASAYAAADIAAAQGGLAAIEDGQRPVFAAHLAELEASAVPVGALEGFNYSRGRPIRITLYRVTPTAMVTSPPEE